jgi:hypothetical protein
MESTTLIPYSVHLRRDIHAKLKAAAGDRKAAGLVRDAITSYIEGGDSYEAGYRSALADILVMIAKDKLANSIAVDGETIASTLQKKVSDKIKMRAPRHGNKKTTR